MISICLNFSNGNRPHSCYWYVIAYRPSQQTAQGKQNNPKIPGVTFPFGGCAEACPVVAVETMREDGV